MELKGKKVVFLGDSITDGCGTSAEEFIYWNQFAKRTGAQVFANGIGGSRITPQRFPGTERPWEERYFASRVEELIPDADIVVVFGGTNDFGTGDAALGTISDQTNDTFYGACHLLVQKLYEKYPKATVVLMTPLHRMSEDEVLYNELGVRRVGPLRVYVQALREIAEFYGLPLVVLFADCPIQPRVESLRQMYMPDGLHPNDAGAGLVAECLQRVLEAL